MGPTGGQFLVKEPRPESGLECQIPRKPESGLDFHANMAHIGQSRPGSGLDFQMKAPKPLKVFPLRS